MEVYSNSVLAISPNETPMYIIVFNKKNTKKQRVIVEITCSLIAWKNCM